MGTLTPTQAGGIDHRLMALLAAHEITAQEYACIHYVLYFERRQDCDRAQVALTTICVGTGRRREAAVSAMRKAEAHGVLWTIKGRQTVIQDGRRVSRNATTIYVFKSPHPESTRRPVLKEEGLSLLSSLFVQKKMLARLDLANPDWWDEAVARVVAAAGMPG